jgi:DNA-binding transcriptional LysR family regulator
MQRRHERLNIPIELLRSFVAIQECGSFTKAAELLHLTQPAISAQVKRLQHLVGGEVFRRTSFGVSLTEKGEIVSRYARRILAMNDQILSLAGVGAVAKALRIGMPSVFAARLLPDVIAACRNIADDRLQFSCDPSPELWRNLLSGYLDIAFIVSATTPAMREYIRWPEQLGWVCADDFLLQPGCAVPLLSWPNGISDQASIDALETAGLRYSIVFVASDFAAQMAALRSGIGLFVLPERIVPRDLKVAREPYLPPLPAYNAGIYVREGLETDHALAVAQAMASVIRPNGAQAG